MQGYYLDSVRKRHPGRTAVHGSNPYKRENHLGPSIILCSFMTRMPKTYSPSPLPTRNTIDNLAPRITFQTDLPLPAGKGSPIGDVILDACGLRGHGEWTKMPTSPSLGHLQPQNPSQVNGSPLDWALRWQMPRKWRKNVFSPCPLHSQRHSGCFPILFRPVHPQGVCNLGACPNGLPYISHTALK